MSPRFDENNVERSFMATQQQKQTWPPCSLFHAFFQIVKYSIYETTSRAIARRHTMSEEIQI